MTAEMGAYIDAECARPQRGVAVVDDNSTQLWHLQAMLSGLGFRVVGIANPIGATNIIARADVQQVLISLEMTGLDGGNLCRLLRHHPRTRALSIMLHSLGSDEGLAAAAQAAGADGHVRADANPANLAQKLLLGARDGRAASSVAVPAAAVAASLPRLVEASLGPAANPPHEKRRERRLTFLASCQLTELASGAALTGYTANLSRGGVALYLSRRLAYGSSVRLGLHDDGPGRREIIGTVRWVRPFDPFFATGISFNLSEEPARRTVGALIDGIDAS
jgi:CheY-like chemotaxis protein